MPRFIFFLLITLIMINADLLYAAGGTTITLPQEVRVKGESATLGDIAKIKSADKALVAKLNGIAICRVPSPGQYTRLSESSLRLKLQTAGIDLEQVAINMPAYVKIYADYKQIESDEILKAALDFIKKQKLSESPSELIPVRKPSYLYAKNGKIEFRCEAAQVGNPKIVSVNVEVLCDGKSVGKRRVSFKDEKADTVNKGKSGSNSPDSGKPSVKEGAIVKAGDPVEVAIIKKNIRVTAMGVVKQNGKAGQMVRIKLDDTNKVVNARLLDEKHAEVEIP
ncbi:MAG: flagella basal body P-ring formation protein FlgA [Firmicutes bacterium]|nr:flagella basal body P-ring formation protein FlgA [Bacillota bacterium]